MQERPKDDEVPYQEVEGKPYDAEGSRSVFWN
jgi:hypothetical protein